MAQNTSLSKHLHDGQCKNTVTELAQVFINKTVVQLPKRRPVRILRRHCDIRHNLNLK